jgi:uncharacterized protein YhdP
MQAPSLKVTMNGTMNLAARKFDEHIHIYPDLSTSATIASFFPGGPIASAAVFFAEKLFTTPLDMLTELTYHLGGSWKNPTLELK